MVSRRTCLQSLGGAVIAAGMPGVAGAEEKAKAAEPRASMPGPFPGRVVAVKSDRCVDTASNTANDEVVREMMARGL